MPGASHRVCLLTSSFPRWAGDATAPFLLHLAWDLRARGWDVGVLAPHAAGAAERETLHGVAVRRYRYAWPASQETLCYGGGALFNLRRDPGNWLKLPLLIFFQTLAVLRVVRRNQCRLIHAHWVLPQGLIAVVIGRLCRIPVVVTVHGSDVFALRGPTALWCKRAALHGAAAVTANSSATEAAVRSIAPNLHLLRRIPMGVVVGQSLPIHADIGRRQHADAGPALIFVGRLVAQKGVDDLLRALACLIPEWPEASATIVGDGPERLHLERRARELAIAPRVRFAGAVEPERVADYLAAGDVFVAPAKAVHDGAAEGQGLALIEAMLAGVPVVASRSGGIIDAVRHEETGLLVDEGAPAQIAAAVTRLMRDRALARRLTRQARTMAAETYTTDRCADAFARLFDEVVAGAHRTAVKR